MSYNKLTPEEAYVILNKGTERPFTGEYNEHFAAGVYTCKQCDAPLYRSEDKFPSHCGWPSFDDEIEGAIRREVDADGRRIEILCANCGGHLGHVFEGEMLTRKNVRHCVNSLSMNFVSAEELARQQGSALKTAYFAGGCFWGVEHLLQQQPGVVSVVSGYMGGHVDNPSYEQVCSKQTGHLETVEVLYDPAVVSFETLAKLFFEIHDPTQEDGQGPDIGPQYASAIFVHDEEERGVSECLIAELENKGLNVVTRVLPMAPFWRAEEFHQDYYVRTGKVPYCHRYQKRF
ncbi:bifunctional methionine sulfoxide reductase B/A protein [Marinobacterium sediminicola]|uniref:Peptide methionine sulfoxide reductase MsrA n=1 Tax=Marinobacterium sediminicola TaxID=518898 RepID=A0ABY1S1M0_9GAMM|nr:bifunctional methionine sulfoxide reductase B/A protein [Marinobacterium sediminicola]ULG69845.1 bifunctional methionine sulfoxide reductase B/A protein [Marinobacterium sediminicola]SMR75340.1 peptide methionine sulfoxide reductase msrA/msrB [Marinobacterium sediminicola]